MRTVAEPFESSEVRVEPADAPGVRINGVPADVGHVQKADVRVDLHGEAGRVFVVEHVLGPLGLAGVTAAEVTGTRDTWAFERPEHRFTYSRDGGPDHVVGHPDGYPNPIIVEGVRAVGIDERAEPTRRTVAEPVTYGGDRGSVTLRPREPGAGLELEIGFRGEHLDVAVDPAGETDPALVDDVVGSRTPFLTESATEGLTHAVADVVGDLALVGGLTDVVVEAELHGAYHELTIGAAAMAHDRGVVVAE